MLPRITSEFAKNGAVVCPSCGEQDLVNVGRRKGNRRKVSLSLLVHPLWLQGEHWWCAPPALSYSGRRFDGAAP